MKKGIMYKLSPFNNETNMSTLLYVIKKVLAFILIYIVSAVLGEGVIIGILYGMGYDPLHGIMPVGQIGELLSYYGFLIFSLVTLLYCRFVEKNSIKFMGFIGKPTDYLLGALLAISLLSVITGVSCVCGSISFCGFQTKIDVKSLLLWIVAFVFLHLSSLMEAASMYTIVGIINLYLISSIFSRLVLWRSNIWIACGLHSVWNFVLYVIMGLRQVLLQQLC